MNQSTKHYVPRRMSTIFRIVVASGLCVIGLIAAITWFAPPLQANVQQVKIDQIVPQSALADEPVTHTVSVINDQFVSSVITITVGDTVQWNRLEGFHNVVSADGLFRLGDPDGEPSTEWDSVSHTFTEVGTFDYHCEPHQFVGMVGTIIVVAAETEPVATETPTATITPTLTGVPVITTTPDITVTKDITPTPVITTTPVMTTTPVVTETPVVTPTETATATVTMTSTPTAIPTVPTVPPVETPTPVSTVPTIPVPGDPMTNTGGMTDTLPYTNVVISEVYFHGGENSQGSFDNDWVELQNIGDETIDISSWYLCARRSYAAVADLAILFGDLELSPGEIVVLGSWTDWQLESDLGLYLDDDGGQPPFSNADFMVDFVQWGSPVNQGRANVAVEKGIWPETGADTYDFVPTPDDGLSIALINGTGLEASDYAAGATTGGQNNPVQQSLFLPFVAPED